jgi:hypothetical protein
MPGLSPPSAAKPLGAFLTGNKKKGKKRKRNALPPTRKISAMGE